MSSVFSKKLIMRIGEVAKRTGFSKDTLRWYEKIGLIHLDRKSRSENNYRSYDAKTLERLLDIRKLKYFGFTLKEVQEFLFLEEIEALSCPSVSEKLAAKIQGIDQQIAELQKLKSRLFHVKENCSGDCKAALNLDA